MASEDELIEARRAKAAQLEGAGSRAFPNTFRPTEAEVTRRAEVVARANDADESVRADLPDEADLPEGAEQVALWGRVVAKRGPFLVLRTPFGDAQALVRKDVLPEAEAAQLAAVDLADHVVVRGPLIKTRTGALAVSARSYGHVGKALLPPPAKWHGLKDVEKRYRERYVDLFANPDVSKVFRARGAIVSQLRRFLDERGYLEVETPTLHSVRGGATAKPFDTHHNALDMDLFLRIAPELYLKRLIVGGLDRVYEIARCFRNEGISTRHNPEFSMLELYQAYASYEELMDLFEAMVRSCDQLVKERFGDLVGERPFDLEAEWRRVPMRDAIVDAAQHLHLDAGGPTIDRALLDDEAATAAFADRLVAGDGGMKLEAPDKKTLAKVRNHGERIFALFELLAEPILTTLYTAGDKSVPVFVTDYPFEVSPLARRNDDEPAYVDRFEIFIDGRELANAFSELNDPDDQASRFEDQLAKAQAGDDEAMQFDHDYIRALRHGMPPAAGLGVGVDRLVMLLLGLPSIRDVLLFPLLRPEA
ncbi:MAG: lysine--tRNA ligase [Sandaracinus sp.]|mgnify:CR=1 FL=1|nr:lysine--tRNA ligase [Sandaracinus sp.]